ASGDVYFDGEWPNASKYIYLEMEPGIEDAPPEVLPYAFAPLATPIATTPLPAPGYVTTRYTDSGGSPVANNRVYYGFNFEDATGLSYLNPTPSGSVDSALSTLLVGTHPSGSTELPLGGPDVGFDLLLNLATDDLVDITPNSAFAVRKFSV